MRILTCLIAVLTLAGVSLAQPATDAQKAGVTNANGFGTMHFATRLGSFRMIDGHGRAEFTFSGTVLISSLKGKYDITGNVKQEYKKGDRIIYSGKGKLVVIGDWRAIHWFGRDLSGYWYGAGMMRLSGEFDREQKTGEYWFDDPAKIQAWPGGSTQDIINPQAQAGINPNVKVKKKG